MNFRLLISSILIGCLIIGSGCTSFNSDGGVGAEPIGEENFDEEFSEDTGTNIAGNKSDDSELDDEFGDLEEEEEPENNQASQEESPSDEFENIEEELDEQKQAEVQEAQPAEEPVLQDEVPPVAELEEPQEPLEPVEPVIAAEPVEITGIKYLANQSGGTVLIETTGVAGFKTRTNPETNQYVVEVANATLPENLKRPYILKEFKDAKFAMIKAYQDPGADTARVVVQLKDYQEPVIQQEGNSILVIPAVVSQVAEEGPPGYESNIETGQGGTPEVTYTYKNTKAVESLILQSRTLEEFLLNNNKFYGKPISLQVTDASVREVINFISEDSGANLVVGDDVDGKISVKLRKVPWDQALVIVMKSKGLGYIRQGNVLRIATLDKLKAERKSAQDIIAEKASATPLKVQVLPVSYAKVEDLKTKIAPFLTTRGKIEFDVRTSSLIITDTEDSIEKARSLVKELDVPPEQVLIEGKIVEAVDSVSESFGINWSTTGSPFNLSESGGAGGGAITATPSLNVSPGTDSGNFALNLSVGQLDVIGQLSATLRLLEQKDLVKVISSPRIVTMNKEEATITQEVQQPFATSNFDASGSLSTEVQFQKFDLNMKVTPQITADSSVILEVDVSRSIPSSGPNANAGGASSSNSSTAKTKVLVANNQTAVIGGIYQGTDTKSESRVPGLANIPVVGWLFKGKDKVENRTELVVFLTPRIISLDQQIIGKKPLAIEKSVQEAKAPVNEAQEDLGAEFSDELDDDLGEFDEDFDE